MWFRRRPRGLATQPGERAEPRGAGEAVVDVGSASEVGRRTDNQDRCHVDARLAVVSDGMGGYRGGARAAELVVGAVVDALTPPVAEDGATTRLLDAVARANDAVRVGRAADRAVHEMGATVTIALAATQERGRSRWLLAHVGDSPAYLVTADDAAAVTTDHTPAAELLLAGVLTEAQAATHHTRHLLLRAIGPDPEVVADLTEVTLGPADALVLCSDGVSGALPAADIGSIVRDAPSAPVAAATLVGAAIERGASDNVTAVVVVQVPSSTP